ncbi:hypothetical protein ACOMHN_030718 [Nucella lapillus]
MLRSRVRSAVESFCRGDSPQGLTLVLTPFPRKSFGGKQAALSAAMLAEARKVTCREKTGVIVQ